MTHTGPAGWLPDPTERFVRRYFDGTNWTDHVANEPGNSLLDPFEPILLTNSGPSPATDGPTPALAGRLRRLRAWWDSGTKQQRKNRLAFLAVVGFVLFLVAAAAAAPPPPEEEDDGNRYAAFEVCTQFVEQRLASPGSAEFPDPHEDDGEVTITGYDGSFTVRSQVDSQNGFGATLRTFFTCEVRHISGANYRLVDLQLS